MIKLIEDEKTSLFEVIERFPILFNTFEQQYPNSTLFLDQRVQEISHLIIYYYI